VTRSLATSHDGQWAVARDGRELTLFANASAAAAKVELDSDDVDIALVGPPTGLVVVSRTENRGTVLLYAPPTFELAARLDLEQASKIGALMGPRFALLSPDSKQCHVVRSAGRALAIQKLETSGPIEFVVGLERNQLMLGLLKKVEVWDAVSGRPLLRPQFQLPPAPRILGTAAGHMWAMREGGDEIFVYRLSDGRPFRHYAGSAIREVVSHPGSPVLVLVTERGLVRLHCFAHSLLLIDNVPEERGALAQLAIGEDITLLGYVGGGRPPWQLPLTSGAPSQVTMDTAAPSTVPATRPVAETTKAKPWREPLVALAADLIKGETPDLPSFAIDTELGELSHRLGLSMPARRVLVALYALHLVGSPAMPISRLAVLVGDWADALGQGDLAALGMLRRKHGTVALRTAVTDFLDGAEPRHVRLVGGAPTTPRAGAFRVSRDARPDAEIEAELVKELGRIAVVQGSLDRALLEARLHGATAVSTTMPTERPLPWPRDAGLVLVLYGTAASWVADLPALTAS
jgi:hypothetical protein